MTRIQTYCCVIVMLFQLSLGFGAPSSEQEKIWKRERKEIRYQKNQTYREAENWYTHEPASLHENKAENEAYEGLDYEPEQIKRNRKLIRDGDDGYVEYGEGYTIDDTPEIEPEKEEDYKRSKPWIPLYVWKIIGVILVVGVVIFVLYQYIKNREPKVKSVKPQPIASNWTPETISKTELELLLEKAELEENYRECVRIYFNFILKELIKKGWIKWKNEKTNYHYTLEMKNKPNNVMFEECVRIYDIVWYGKYTMSKKQYEELQPFFLNYYKLAEQDVK